MQVDDTIREQAASWAAATGDPAFEDWDAFTLWLEQDPRHAEAYDRTVAAVDEGVAILAAATPANDAEPAAPAAPRRRWLGGVLAMGLAAFLGLALWRQGAPDLYTVETAPGAMRIVELGPETSVAIAGGSRLTFDRNDPRFASLDHGRALFTVRHDEDAPFRVTAGQAQIVDVGTIFDVRLDDEAFRVAVSEGAVQFNPEAEDVHVAAGQVLTRTDDGYRIAPVDMAQVGDWREGRLSFEEETLAAVALELSRATGLTFAVDPASADRTITGSILVDPVRKDPASLGPLLGIAVTQASGTWVIGAR